MKQIFIITFFLYSIPLFSHTLIFRDLQVVKGIVYKQDNSYVYFKTENGNKDVKVRKETIGSIIIQDITDNAVLKKLIKGIKDKYPNYKPPAKDSPMQEGIADIEIQNVGFLVAEIEEDEKLNTIKLKRRDALFKSILFSGLAHFELDRKTWGYFYSGTFLVLTIGAIYQNQKLNEELSKYEKNVSNNLFLSFLYNPNFNEHRGINASLFSSQLDQNAFKNVEAMEASRNQLAIGAGAIYLIQIAHTYLIGKSSEKELDKKKSSLDFKGNRENYFGNQGFFASVQYDFVF